MTNLVGQLRDRLNYVLCVLRIIILSIIHSIWYYIGTDKTITAKHTLLNKILISTCNIDNFTSKINSTCNSKFALYVKDISPL